MAAHLLLSIRPRTKSILLKMHLPQAQSRSARTTITPLSFTAEKAEQSAASMLTMILSSIRARAQCQSQPVTLQSGKKPTARPSNTHQAITIMPRRLPACRKTSSSPKTKTTATHFKESRLKATKSQSAQRLSSKLNIMKTPKNKKQQVKVASPAVAKSHSRTTPLTAPFPSTHLKSIAMTIRLLIKLRLHLQPTTRNGLLPLRI